MATSNLFCRCGLALPAGYADLQAKPHPQNSSNFHHERGRYRKAKAGGDSITESTLLGTRHELQLWRLPSSPANLANAPERAAETSHIKAHNRTPPDLSF